MAFSVTPKDMIIWSDVLNEFSKSTPLFFTDQKFI